MYSINMVVSNIKIKLQQYVTNMNGWFSIDEFL